MVERLEKLRAPWLARAALDDPMRFNETSFRVLEMVIINDLLDREASSRLMRKAHNVPQRLAAVPD
eukprot:8522655-Karenia_brevis.AAC.1